jgi:hypothetical protein
MRTSRRHFRQLVTTFPGPDDPDLGAPITPDLGTRLRDGTIIPDHDDWDCVEDLLAAGLLTAIPEPDHPERWGLIRLTPAGQRHVAALRVHKQQGGTLDTYAWSADPASRPRAARRPD